MPQLHLYVPDDLAEEIRQRAESRGVSVFRFLSELVCQALLQHKRAGNPVATWRDGKVAWIPPEEIQVEEEAR